MWPNSVPQLNKDGSLQENKILIQSVSQRLNTDPIIGVW